MNELGKIKLLSNVVRKFIGFRVRKVDFEVILLEG